MGKKAYYVNAAQYTYLKMRPNLVCNITYKCNGYKGSGTQKRSGNGLDEMEEDSEGIRDSTIVATTITATAAKSEIDGQMFNERVIQSISDLV